MASACGGSSRTAPVTPSSNTPPPPVTTPPTSDFTLSEGLLRDSFRNNFSMGTAVTAVQIDSGDISARLAREQFNVVTPEYELKPDQIAPSEGVFNFGPADRVVNWALENNMTVTGHALLWHEATPDYFYEGTPAQIRARLENYITTVMQYFEGRITVWDVVNEVTSVDIFNGDDGVGPDRRSRWFEATGGADYIDWAFLAARAADPNAQLFLSDYETENPFKMNWTMEIVRRLLQRGIPIDGVGHQFHLQLDTEASTALAAIDAVTNEFAGLVNHVTELDVNFYQNSGQCWQTGTGCQPDIGPTPPAASLAAQARLLRDLFNGLVNRSTVESVNVWGVRDNDSWLNFAPITRTNYPLLLDRAGEAKPAFRAIIDQNYVI
jgi:endo-1,4-beta-xylanase